SNDGLYDSRTRVDNPTLGIWMQNDPLGFGAGDVNFYRYEANNPASVTDPRGTAWIAALGESSINDKSSSTITIAKTNDGEKPPTEGVTVTVWPNNYTKGTSFGPQDVAFLWLEGQDTVRPNDKTIPLPDGTYHIKIHFTVEVSTLLDPATNDFS